MATLVLLIMFTLHVLFVTGPGLLSDLLLLVSFEDLFLDGLEELVYFLDLVTPLKHLADVDTGIVIIVTGQEVADVLLVDLIRKPVDLVSCVAAGDEHKLKVHQGETVQFVEVK